MSRLINDVLFGPEDTGGGAPPIEDKALNQAGLEEFLKDDDTGDENEVELIDLKDDKKDKSKKEKDEKIEDDEDDSTESEDADEDDEENDEDEKSLEDELEEDLAEPDEDKLEALIAPVRRKEILAKYPNLFKEFPHLEHAYYREQKYTELLPSIKDAEVAVEKAATWDRFESELSDGEFKPILESLAQHDKNAFHKVADTILETIREIDAPAAEHIYAGVAKQIIELMVDAGGVQGQEGLKTAAHLVHQFLFGARPYEPHKPLHKQVTKDPRADEVTKREQEFVKKQFTIARDEVGTKINNSIKATIERNIDPKNSMSGYVKGKAVEDVLGDVQNQMKGDARFQKILNRLWQNALDKDFNDDSKAAIRSAVMSKAKQLLLPAIQKGRKNALGTKVRAEKEITRPEKSGPSNTKGKSTSPMNRGNEKGKIPAGMSTRDFLMSD